jgi:hypothetical protein
LILLLGIDIKDYLDLATEFYCIKRVVISKACELYLLQKFMDNCVTPSTEMNAYDSTNMGWNVIQSMKEGLVIRAEWN